VSERTRSRRSGRGLACIVAVTTAVVVSTSCSSGDSSSGRSTTTARPTTTAAAGPPAGATAEGLRSLKAGQCFDLPADDPEAEDRAVWVVDCSQPHTHEVFDVVTYAGPVLKGGGYAGTAAVQDWAEQACYDRFEPFVGIPWTRSDLEIETWWPSEESWGRSDRTAICTVFPQNGGRTTGTQRGAGR
jgi:hypothetical protein